MSYNKNNKKEKRNSLKKKKEENLKLKNQEIEKLKKSLIRKIYNDLYEENTKLYEINNFTFEDFIFYFYKDIESHIDFKNPDYSKLFKIMDLKVKAKFQKENKLIRINDNEKKIEKNNENEEDDDWKLIFKYQQILYDEKEKRKQKEKEEKEKKYYEELKEQIKMKKNPIDEIEKNKEDEYLYNEKEAFKQLQKTKIKNLDNIQMINKENSLKKDFLKKLNLDKENFNEITNENNTQAKNYNNNILKNFLLEESEQDNLISKLVDQIMYEKKINKLNDILQNVKDKNKEYKQKNQISINKKIIKEDNNNYNFFSDFLNK